MRQLEPELEFLGLRQDLVRFYSWPGNYPNCIESRAFMETVSFGR